MKKIALVIFTMAIFSCRTQDPCVDLHSWNYTEFWYYEGPERYQVYKTFDGRLFVFVLNRDSTNFKRKYLK